MKSVFGLVLLVCLCVLSPPTNFTAQARSFGSSPQRPATSISRTSIRGTVVDPSGAVISAAEIGLTPDPADSSTPQTTRTSSEGRYALDNIAPGTYLLRVVAKGFAVFESKPFQITGGRAETFNVQLGLNTARVQVDVSGDAAVDTDPGRNADAAILRGSAIQDLPTDPSVLDQEIRSLSSGLSPTIYVDNFSGAAIPPKSAIREIRINQNPYSARNDTDPTNGTVEIFTKPGTEKLHATFFMAGSDSAFDSRNPFVASQPPYYFTQYEGDLGGSLTHSTSYFFDLRRRVDAGNAIINAETLDSNLNPIQNIQAIPSPATDTTFSPRFDFQPGSKSTIGLRYIWSANRQTNGGLGQLSLLDQAFQYDTVTQTLQVSNSQILSTRVVNDTRFQYARARTRQTPASDAPTLDVEGAFISGGNPAGSFHDNQDRFEINNYLAIQAGRHYLSPGLRLRLVRDANVTFANRNGEFIFPTLDAYQAAARTLAQCQHSFAPRPCTASGASQFSITTGETAAIVSVADIAAFYQDDWKLRRQFTLSYGLRYETQNHLSDLGDFAPRVAISWGLGATDKKAPLLVLRLGSGVFYNRLGTTQLLQAQRQNGTSQFNYIIANPTFYPLLPSPTSLGAQSLPTTFHIAAGFHSPYTWNNTLALEHPLGTRGAIAFNYVFGRSVHLGVTRNINAPLPGTYDPNAPASGVRPLGTTQVVEQYESSGIANTNRLFGSINLRGKGDRFLYSSYTLRLRNTDVPIGLPSNSYNLAADYGRAASNVHIFILDGNTPIPFTGISLSGYIDVTSGTPFNIIVGQDLNGDSQFNDRPAFATDLSRPSVIQTPLGAFDTSPIAGQKIVPVNYATGPAHISTNLQLYRNFTFGPPLPGPASAPTTGRRSVDRKYNLLLGVEAQNPINHTNYDLPVGVLGSPLFGKSTALAGGATTNANRVINLLLEARF